MKETLGVIGAGSWGTTLAWLLARNGHPVLLWARRESLCEEINETHRNPRYTGDTELPPSLEATPDLARVCEAARLLLTVVPSHGFREVARHMGDHLTGAHCVVHATKGIEQQSFSRMSEVLREETCVRKIGVLAGPNLSKEILAGAPAGTLVASRYPEVVEGCLRALHGGAFRVYGGEDVVGAEIGGAFKNIVAVASGVVDGLELGDNTRALLLTRGLHEMAVLGTAMGASVLTFGGLAGIGDLMATCASPLSRNHQVGARLARGETREQIQESMHMVAEGVKTARAVHAYARHKGLDLPIVQAVFEVLYQNRPVREAVEALMARPPGRELVELAW